MAQATQKDWKMHEILLAGWGCPIGELFDLEKLSEHCEKTKRWSFFVTSEVCNVSLLIFFLFHRLTGIISGTGGRF
jgi:hypothetical protein